MDNQEMQETLERFEKMLDTENKPDLDLTMPCGECGDE